MTKKIKTTGTVLYIKTLKNTTLGNPRFYVVINTEPGAVLCGNTASNSMFCYRMPNEGDRVELIYHETKLQRKIIFDDLTVMK